MSGNAGSHAERRAALARQYDELARLGTTAYWRRIEQTAPTADGEPLAREVLARCVQEHALAGRLAEAHRVIKALFSRIEADVRAWARRCGAPAHGALDDDLQQECYLALWAELSTPGPTFFTVHFGHALHRLQQHVGQQALVGEGLRHKRGVDKPDRVPAKLRESLQAPPAPVDAGGAVPLPPAERLADARALTPFVAADLSDLLDHVKRLSLKERALIYALFWQDATQEQAAEQLQVDTRTIHNYLRAIRERLRVQYGGGEEVTDGGAAR